MRKFGFSLLLAVLIVLSLSCPAQAYRIFVWQHDNGLTTNDPVLGGTLTVTQAITRTLSNLGLQYDVNQTLPSAAELEQYDVVVVALSFYCPG